MRLNQRSPDSSPVYDNHWRNTVNNLIQIIEFVRLSSVRSSCLTICAHLFKVHLRLRPTLDLCVLPGQNWPCSGPTLLRCSRRRRRWPVIPPSLWHTPQHCVVIGQEPNAAFVADWWEHWRESVCLSLCLYSTITESSVGRIQVPTYFAWCPRQSPTAPVASTAAVDRSLGYCIE